MPAKPPRDPFAAGGGTMAAMARTKSDRLTIPAMRPPRITGSRFTS